MSGAPDLDALRGEMRQRRARLSSRQRQHSSDRICELLLADLRFRRARTVGVYCPVSGEIDITPLIETLWGWQRTVCLPLIAKRGRGMSFRRVDPDSEMRADRYGILAPVSASPIPRSQIDLLLTPLVAFDAEGRRLGMGAGYFDRYLAGLAQRRRPSRPRVFGCAYEFQEVPRIPENAWDIPLDAVVTEAGIRRFRN